MLVVVAAWRELRPAATARRRQAALEMIEPGRSRLARGERLGVVSGATVGRSADATLRLDDASVSSRHATLHHDRGRWWLEDLDSTNGTFINDARVTGRAQLHAGDVVQFGLVTARFVGS